MKIRVLSSVFALAVLVLPALASLSDPESGLAVGDMVTPFHPRHVSGPFKGTDECPP